MVLGCFDICSIRLVSLDYSVISVFWKLLICSSDCQNVKKSRLASFCGDFQPKASKEPQCCLHKLDLIVLWINKWFDKVPSVDQCLQPGSWGCSTDLRFCSSGIFVGGGQSVVVDRHQVRGHSLDRRPFRKIGHAHLELPGKIFWNIPAFSKSTARVFYPSLSLATTFVSPTTPGYELELEWLFSRHGKELVHFGENWWDEMEPSEEKLHREVMLAKGFTLWPLTLQNVLTLQTV